MKVVMDFDEHQAMKEKRSKKMNEKSKEIYGYEDDLELSMDKKKRNKNAKGNKSKNKGFKNDYKKLNYDDDEDMDWLDYDIDEYKYR